MALYAIGDTHLSLSKDKPMDIFGDKWADHAEKLRRGFSKLNEDDVCVICGDLSWGMGLEETKEDFRFINSLPGRTNAVVISKIVVIPRKNIIQTSCLFL